MNLLSAPTTANDRLPSLSSNRSSNVSNVDNLDEKELAKKKKRDE